MCVQPRLHSCVQDHLKLRRLHVPWHSDAAVLFPHQTLCGEGRKGRQREGKVRKNGQEICIMMVEAILGIYFLNHWCRVNGGVNEAHGAGNFRATGATAVQLGDRAASLRQRGCSRQHSPR